MDIPAKAELNFWIFPTLFEHFPVLDEGVENSFAERDGDLVGRFESEPALEVEPRFDFRLGLLAALGQQGVRHHCDRLPGALVGVRGREPRQQLVFDIVPRAGENNDDRAIALDAPGFMRAVGRRYNDVVVEAPPR